MRGFVNGRICHHAAQARLTIRFNPISFYACLLLGHEVVSPHLLQIDNLAREGAASQLHRLTEGISASIAVSSENERIAVL